MPDEILRFIGEVSIQAAAAGDGQKRPTFRLVAYDGQPMRVSGFNSVIVDLKGADVSGTIPLLESHGEALDNIIGQGIARIEANQIVVSGTLTDATPSGAKAIALSRSGISLQASIGFAPEKREHLRGGDTVRMNGSSFTAPPDGMTIIRSGRLREVSLVSVGASAGTKVQIAAKAVLQKGNQNMENDNEFVMTPEKTAILEANFHSATCDPELEQRRLQLIECWAPRLGASASVELQAKAADLRARAVGGEISLDQLRLGGLEIIRAQRPKAPTIHAGGIDTNSDVIEAAFCRSAGLQDLDKQFRPEVLEAADRMRGFGLGELILRCAAEAGYSGRTRIGAGNINEVMRAAFSTHTLSTLLTTMGNKILLDGFTSIPQSWREVAQVRPVSDFKEVTAYRLTTALEYEEVGPAGEIKHGTAGQESYELQAKTYAKMLALTRQDIINDDLGAFNDLRNRFGIGAAIALNKVFWKAWLEAYDGAAFWTAARGNLVTSATLAEAGLNKAVAAFRKLSGPDGNMMSLTPKFLLVPPDLESTALKLYSSQEVRDTTASTKTLTANIFWNRFKPLIAPELSNAAFPGYSATTWFLLADPKILASAIVCFLNGQESPTIESADSDFNTLGIQFRGYHDFGVSMSEWQASVAAEA